MIYECCASNVRGLVRDAAAGAEQNRKYRALCDGKRDNAHKVLK